MDDSIHQEGSYHPADCRARDVSNHPSPQLIPVTALPEPYSDFFAFNHFNSVQSECFPTMNQLAAAHKIQGMLIVASAWSSGNLFVQVGTELGQNFLGMLMAGSNPLAKFHTYVAGMAAVEEISTGGDPAATEGKSDKRKANVIEETHKEDDPAQVPPKYCLTPLRNNKKLISNQLAKVQLKVKQNPTQFQAKELWQPVNTMLINPLQRIIQAFGKGWILFEYKPEGVDNTLKSNSENPPPPKKSRLKSSRKKTRGGKSRQSLEDESSASDSGSESNDDNITGLLDSGEDNNEGDNSNDEFNE
ncbi:hypothetical protein PtB15_11B626 [Puccinia triticina]|nr:hypothetical protein PtB15_11B626 [Puccinia triticina]